MNYLEGIADYVQKKSMRLTRKEARDRINKEWASWWFYRACTSHWTLFIKMIDRYELNFCSVCEKVHFDDICPECGRD